MGKPRGVAVYPKTRRIYDRQRIRPHFLTELKKEREEKQLLAEQNAVLLPKAELHDLFLSADNCQSMNIVAKSLGIGRNILFKVLRDRKILMYNNTPYQEYIDRGYFKVVEKPIIMGGEAINKPQTLVTSKGVDYIAKLLKEKAS
ncbi:MAG: hypothetical protein HPY66_1721 [Firmicutes bacterium]|nr:hypothetical protein [Bacillota bacterium]